VEGELTIAAPMAPKPTKRRRVTGIGEEDTLARLYQGLQDAQAMFDHEAVVEGQPLPPGADIAQRTTALMELIQTKMDGIKVYVYYCFDPF